MVADGASKEEIEAAVQDDTTKHLRLSHMEADEFAKFLKCQEAIAETSQVGS